MSTTLFFLGRDAGVYRRVGVVLLLRVLDDLKDIVLSASAGDLPWAAQMQVHLTFAGSPKNKLRWIWSA